MDIKKINKNKLATGIAVVALSGFVPTPHNNAMAETATANLNVQAEVLQQLSASSSQALNFGQFVATSTNGYVEIDTAGAFDASNAQSVSAGAAGLITFNGSTGSYVFAATNLGANGFALMTGATATPATILLTKLIFGTNADGLAAGFTLTAGTAADYTTNANLQGNANAANAVGGRLAWTGGAPAVGSYSGTIDVTVTRP